jgi:cell wall-associated NlpC family hydrolase
MKPVMLLALLVAFVLPPAHATPGSDVSIYAVSLVGTPYRLGGSGPKQGLDCSGFVGHVFHQTLGLQLPRDSLAMSRFARPLAREELQPGDLVFFNTLNRAYSHVGIYLGDDRFVHASSSRSGGVMVSRLGDAYWRTRFDGAGRIVPDLPVQTADAWLE